MSENPSLPEGPNNKDDTDRFTDFMRTLAPPPVLPLSQQALQGQSLFTRINCVACHIPSMRTGPSPVAPLAFKNVPYTLICSSTIWVRSETSIAQAAALPNEMRTAPLWGLRARIPYLHDGRASTILEAITLHDGEGRTVRDRFLALPATGQLAIVAFLNSI